MLKLTHWVYWVQPVADLVKKTRLSALYDFLGISCLGWFQVEVLDIGP